MLLELLSLTKFTRCRQVILSEIAAESWSNMFSHRHTPAWYTKMAAVTWSGNTKQCQLHWVYSPIIYTCNPLYTANCSRSVVRCLKTTGSALHAQHMNVVWKLVPTGRPDFIRVTTCTSTPQPMLVKYYASGIASPWTLVWLRCLNMGKIKEMDNVSS